MCDESYAAPLAAHGLAERPLRGRHSDLACRPDAAMEPLREWIERGDEAPLDGRRARVRHLRKPEACVARQRAPIRRSSDERVAIVTVCFDRLLQRLLEERDRVVRLRRRRLLHAELLEDALTVVGDARDSLPGFAR